MGSENSPLSLCNLKFIMDCYFRLFQPDGGARGKCVQRVITTTLKEFHFITSLKSVWHAEVCLLTTTGKLKG